MSLEHTMELLRAEERGYLEKLEACRADMAELAGDSEKVRAVSISEWAAMDIGSVTWLVGGLIATQSVTVFAADPAVGKSTILDQLAVCVGTGKSFVGFHATEAAPVLTIAAEGSEAARRNRYLTCCQSLGVSVDALRAYVKPSRLNEYEIGSKNFESLIESCGARLAILDTIGYFHNGDENDANDWKRCVMKPLRALSSKHGCAFILVHHHNKGADRQGWHKGRGTTAMFGDCDHWLRLEKAEGAPETARDLWVDKNKYGRMDYRVSLNFRMGGAVFEER